MRHPTTPPARLRPTLLTACVLLGAIVAPSGDTSNASAPDEGRMRAMTPVRLVDTRVGVGGASLEAGESRTIRLADAVPSGATAVSLNLTAITPSESTYLTVWPSGSARPRASNLNVAPGSTRPNAVLVGLGADRSVEIYNDAGTVDVLVDVMGYSTGSFTGVTPHRVLDTRSGVGGATLEAGSVRRLPVAGVAGVPSDAVAVALNLTATGSSVPTRLTVSPSGTSNPVTSNLNVRPGETLANLAVVGAGDDGLVDLRNGHGSVDAIADLLGWFDADGDLVPFAPRRVVDTRAAECDVRLGPGESRRIAVGSVDAEAHVVSVTVVGATEPTHLRVWPAGDDLVPTSNVNVADAGATANAVVVGSGDDGAIEVYNASGRVDLIVDLFGSFGVEGPPTLTAPSGGAERCAAPTGSGGEASASLNELEQDLLDATNAARDDVGLAPLRACATLSAAARSFAEHTAASGTLSHTGPGGTDPAARALAAGYDSTIVGENLAIGFSSAAAVVEAWLASPGHRANVLRDLDHAGVGVVEHSSGTAWVQMFGSGGTCS